MDVENKDPLMDIAEQVADWLADRGYAFVEDDKLPALADTLRAFLRTAGIAVCGHERTAR
ncbi:hypothetical protein [Krasilnikovia sp. M28-CT-15]|uniref:hypothetical protein n=1 Tax=Krasilnikovia sp. M28-CT-15 TaxID=3373540 RepID=UPI00399D4D40